eukprot:3269162-Alexandrium_andersonii.AAC.1
MLWRARARARGCPMSAFSWPQCLARTCNACPRRAPICTALAPHCTAPAGIKGSQRPPPCFGRHATLSRLSQ